MSMQHTLCTCTCTVHVHNVCCMVGSGMLLIAARHGRGQVMRRYVAMSARISSL